MEFTPTVDKSQAFFVKKIISPQQPIKSHRRTAPFYCHPSRSATRLREGWQ